MRVALLGLGLIGGSIAQALRKDADAWSIAAWSPSGAGLALARSEGVIDEQSRSAADAVRGSDLVVLAGPPLACLAQVDDLSGPLAEALGPDTVVTDVVSTKDVICRRADAAGLRFVGGHPMSGREVSGYASASADLFVGQPWIVIPGSHAKPGDRQRVESLATACGARPIAMTAREHDAVVAAISHLPLVVAAALVETVAGRGADPDRPDWPAAAGLAASGWRGMTRLARGDEEMGAGIIATNAPAIAGRLRDLRTVIDGWLEELDRDGGPDVPSIAARLAAARRRLEEAD